MATKAKGKPKAKPKPSVNGTPPDVLTLAEAAAFLRVSEVGLRTDVEAGRVPGRTVGGEWRFSLAGLTHWLSSPPAVDARSQKQRISALIGVWKDDPTIEPMVEQIYHDRKRQTVGGA